MNNLPEHKKRTAFYIFVVVILLIVLSNPVELDPAITEPTPTPQAVKSIVEPINEPINDIVITNINQLRHDRGLNPLVYDYKLTAGANKRAKDMSDINQWSHEGYHEALKEAGLIYGNHAENLALYRDDSEVVNAWLNSPPHAELMLSPEYFRVGVGRYEGYTVLWMSN